MSKERKKSRTPKLQFHPVTPARLDDLQKFSEAHGKFRYCSCMRWRMASSEFQSSTKEKRIKRLEKMVRDETPVGILAYAEGEPIGWCSIAPRETYEALERSRTLPRIDDRPVWSVACFFIDREFRRQEVSLGLLKAAVKYGRAQGAKGIEGYPVEPDATSYTFMGSPGTFREAGFKDVTPEGQKRLVMRREFR